MHHRENAVFAWNSYLFWDSRYIVQRRARALSSQAAGHPSFKGLSSHPHALGQKRTIDWRPSNRYSFGGCFFLLFIFVFCYVLCLRVCWKTCLLLLHAFKPQTPCGDNIRGYSGQALVLSHFSDYWTPLEITCTLKNKKRRSFPENRTNNEPN